MREDYQELWRLFRKGDRHSYNRLIREFAVPLHRYGVRLNRNEEFIKDCIQDIFFELWNRRDRINETPSVKSYLFKALRLRIFREQPKWSLSLPLEEDYEFDVEFSIENKLIEEQTSLELTEKMAAILNNLPKRQKEIIYLRFYESLNREQIAEVMGMNKQSVYNLMHTSILNLRKEWFKAALTFGVIAIR